MNFLAVALLAVMPTFIAYSVTNVQKIADNQYKGELNIVRDAKNALPEGVHQYLILETSGCDHVPAANEGGIYVSGPNGNAILFASGPTCKVTGITVEETK